MRPLPKSLTAIALIMTSALMQSPAFGADKATVEDRVHKLEKEMRAVQRKVFPGGAPIEPDITSQAPAELPTPAATPLTDLMARVTSLEGQLATLTGQVEQNSYKLRQLEDQFGKLQAQLAPPAPEAETTAGMTPAAAAKPAAGSTGASDARKAAVAAIERPDTGDAANDSYVYGYRLWDAKFYPEAEVQLKATVEKYGDTVIGSRAQNLLGRAYLDDGKPALASVAFYENYQKRPTGDRASQSLAYLGEALIQLKKPADACKVYSELKGNYTLSSDLQAMVDKGRARAKCGA